MTLAQKLIDQAKSNGGAIEFKIGGGSGNTLNTARAIRRAGHSVEFVSGKWQSKEGMLMRLTLAH